MYALQHAEPEPGVVEEYERVCRELHKEKGEEGEPNVSLVC